MRRNFLAVVAAVAALAAFAGGGQAQTQSKPKLYLGALTCNVSGSAGFIFGSTRTLSCLFLTTAGKSEHYHGTINRYGIDIGYTKAAHVVWHVYTLGSDRGAGALAGDFLGSQETLSLGLSGGGNILIGGVNKEIVMQSVTVEQNAGINFADGIAEISLKTGV